MAESEPTPARKVARSSAPTVQDVAAAAGVSPMTVSRVLGGGLNVRPEKVRAVTEAIAALGYRKNENARSIRPGQRTRLLGVIITNVANPYYGELQLGVEEVAHQQGVRLLVGNSGEEIDREIALVHDFIGRQVDGLIVVPSGGETAHLKAAQLAGVPLVLASRLVDGISTDAVLIDDPHGAFEGTRALIDEGHTRIAYVGNAPSVFTARRRLDGYTRALADAGIPLADELIRAGQNDSESARLAMRALLDLAQPPTAVFSANNRNTVGVLRAITEAEGATNRMHVMGFDNFDLSDLLPFQLSVVDHDARKLGRTAGEMIVERLQAGADIPPRLVELPTRLLR